MNIDRIWRDYISAISDRPFQDDLELMRVKVEGDAPIPAASMIMRFSHDAYAEVLKSIRGHAKDFRLYLWCSEAVPETSSFAICNEGEVWYKGHGLDFEKSHEIRLVQPVPVNDIIWDFLHRRRVPYDIGSDYLRTASAEGTEVELLERSPVRDAGEEYLDSRLEDLLRE